MTEQTVDKRALAYEPVVIEDVTYLILKGEMIEVKDEEGEIVSALKQDGRYKVWLALSTMFDTAEARSIMVEQHGEACFSKFDLSNEATRYVVAEQIGESWTEHKGHTQAVSALEEHESILRDIEARYGLTDPTFDVKGSIEKAEGGLVVGSSDAYPAESAELISVIRTFDDDGETLWNVSYSLDMGELESVGLCNRFLTANATLDATKAAFWAFAKENDISRPEGTDVRFSKDGFEFTGVRKAPAKATGTKVSRNPMTLTANVGGQSYSVSGAQKGLLGKLADKAGVEVKNRDDGGNVIYALRKNNGGLNQGHWSLTSEDGIPDWMTSLVIDK